VPKNRPRPSSLPRALVMLTIASAVAGCAHTVLEPQLHPADAVPRAAPLPILKAHMVSGELFILDSWRVSDDGARLTGTGTRYSMRREPMGSGPVSIAVSDVALVETNRPDKVGSGGTAVLAVMSTVFGGLSFYCLANPKSCFGSCPTFYLDGDDERPVAEGFSASIARALEARDVDALGPTASGQRRLRVTMRNEAFETHVVRRVRLRVAERPPGGRVLAGVDGRFYPATRLVAPRSCRGDEGDCLAGLAAVGGEERLSPADPRDLATRETVELEFPPTGGALGLVVGGRQTLLSTHLFYQTMAWLGSRAGDYLAALERGGPAQAGRAMGMARVLGGVEAEVSEGGGEWRPIQRHGFGGHAALTWALAGGLVTGGAMAGACASADGGNCGVVALVTAGAWLLVGALAAPAMESSSQDRFTRPVPDQVRPYARLPQGLPEGVDPASLAKTHEVENR